MRLAMMIIGTLLAVFLIIKYIKGKKYADLIEGLEDDNEYPLKEHDQKRKYRSHNSGKACPCDS